MSTTTITKATPAQRRFMGDVAANGGLPTRPVSSTVIRNCHKAGFTTVGKDGTTHLTSAGFAAIGRPAPTTTPVETYVALRAMKGRGTNTMPLDLTVGNVIRVDGMKWRVMEAPQVVETGSVAVESYNEDNQFETLFLSARQPVRVIGNLP